MRDFFRLLHGWTQTININEKGTVRSARGFIQPVSVTDPQYRSRPAFPGMVDDRRYLLIAEPAAIVSGEEGITVEAEGRQYELLRCEMLGGGSHWEGIMKLKAGGQNAG